MKTLITQSELKKRVMLAFFEAAQEDEHGLFARNIAKLLEVEVGLHRLELAINDLYNDGYIESKWSPIERETGKAISSKGYAYVEDLLNKAEIASKAFEVEGQKHLLDISTLIPASDRMVALDHNSAPYREVLTGIGELAEELRGANDLSCSPEERNRVLTSLEAAKELWGAAELKAIQIYVGVLMAIQDAIALLKAIGKAVGKDLIVSAIANLLRSKGISI